MTVRAPFRLPSTALSLPAAPSSNYTATIGGVPVNVKAGTINVQNQIGQRSTGNLQVWGPLGVVWQYGTQVQILDETGTLVYAGFTTKDKATKAGARQGTGYLEHSVSLMDNCYKADKRRAFKTYLAATAGFIVNDLLGAYLSAEGVTSRPGSIASGATIPEVIWNGTKSVGACLTWLATQCGYWWNIDVHGVLWFQPYGGTPAPFVLDGTQADALTATVEFGNDLYINTQYVKGSLAEKGSKTAQLYQAFHGDGVTRSFTLPYEVAHIYRVLLNSADVTVRVLNGKASTGGWFTYAVGDAVLAQDPSQTILGSGDLLEVYYTGRYPVLAVAKNPALVAAQRAREGGGSGLVESVYTNTKVRTYQAAVGIASSLLAHYGSDATLLEFDTRTKGLMPGQMLTVNLPDYGSTMVNKQMLISDVTISDQNDGYNIWFHVKAVGSPVEAAQWQTYWANLMQQSSDPSDYTDTADTSLAPIFSSALVRTPTVTVAATKTTCALIPATVPFTVC